MATASPKTKLIFSDLLQEILKNEGDRQVQAQKDRLAQITGAVDQSNQQLQAKGRLGKLKSRIEESLVKDREEKQPSAADQEQQDEFNIGADIGFQGVGGISQLPKIPTPKVALEAGPNAAGGRLLSAANAGTTVREFIDEGGQPVASTEGLSSDELAGIQERTTTSVPRSRRDGRRGLLSLLRGRGTKTSVSLSRALRPEAVESLMASRARAAQGLASALREKAEVATRAADSYQKSVQGATPADAATYASFMVSGDPMKALTFKLRKIAESEQGTTNASVLVHDQVDQAKQSIRIAAIENIGETQSAYFKSAGFSDGGNTADQLREMEAAFILSDTKWWERLVGAEGQREADVAAGNLMLVMGGSMVNRGIYMVVTGVNDQSTLDKLNVTGKLKKRVAGDRGFLRYSAPKIIRSLYVLDGSFGTVSKKDQRDAFDYVSNIPFFSILDGGNGNYTLGVTPPPAKGIDAVADANYFSASYLMGAYNAMKDNNAGVDEFISGSDNTDVGKFGEPEFEDIAVQPNPGPPAASQAVPQAAAPPQRQLPPALSNLVDERQTQSTSRLQQFLQRIQAGR